MARALVAPGARIAVVGAGAGGLAAARVLQEAGYQPTVFERNSEVGGQWNYGAFGSAMYENLCCNLPKEVMQYRCVPFSHYGGSSFLTHQQVQEYLVDYSNRFYLRSLIRFNTAVTYITPCDTAWRVTVTSAGSTDEVETFDAVCIANGHHSKANSYIPKGTPQFRKKGGTVRHSSTYRNADSYIGRRVIVVGANLSGTLSALSLRVSRR